MSAIDCFSLGVRCFKNHTFDLQFTICFTKTFSTIAKMTKLLKCFRLELVNTCQAVVAQQRISTMFTSFPGYPDEYGRRTYNRSE